MIFTLENFKKILKENILKDVITEIMPDDAKCIINLIEELEKDYKYISEETPYG